MKYSEKDLQRKLVTWFKTHKYFFLNTHFFSSEQDWISFLKSGYCWEIEVKVSKSDFKRDFKKKKHTVMKAVYGRKRKSDLDKKVPNRFYFFCPEGVVSKSEIPDYAGLLVLTKGTYQIKKVKEAPLLHKTKLRPERVFKKLYYLYREGVVRKLFGRPIF